MQQQSRGVLDRSSYLPLPRHLSRTFYLCPGIICNPSTIGLGTALLCDISSTDFVQVRRRSSNGSIGSTTVVVGSGSAGRSDGRVLYRFIVCVGYNECARRRYLSALSPPPYKNVWKPARLRHYTTTRCGECVRDPASACHRRVDHTRRSPGTTQHTVHVNSRT